MNNTLSDIMTVCKACMFVVGVCLFTAASSSAAAMMNSTSAAMSAAESSAAVQQANNAMVQSALFSVCVSVCM